VLSGPEPTFGFWWTSSYLNTSYKPLTHGAARGDLRVNSNVSGIAFIPSASFGSCVVTYLKQLYEYEYNKTRTRSTTLWTSLKNCNKSLFTLPTYRTFLIIIQDIEFFQVSFLKASLVRLPLWYMYICLQFASARRRITPTRPFRLSE
jgi:hypothetical protein